MLFLYSLKINELIQSSYVGAYFFNSTALKIPVLQINIPFVFHRTRAVDVKLILKFLQLIYDFPASNNTTTLCVYISLVVPDLYVNPQPNCNRTVLQALCWGKERRLDSRAAVLVDVGMNVKHPSLVLSSINSNRSFA